MHMRTSSRIAAAVVAAAFAQAALAQGYPSKGVAAPCEWHPLS